MCIRKNQPRLTYKTEGTDSFPNGLGAFVTSTPFITILITTLFFGRCFSVWILLTILALSPLFYSPMRDGTAYYGNNSIYLAFQVGLFHGQSSQNFYFYFCLGQKTDARRLYKAMRKSESSPLSLPYHPTEHRV